MKNTLKFTLILFFLLTVFGIYSFLDRKDINDSQEYLKDYKVILENTELEQKRLQKLYQQGFTKKAKQQAKHFIKANLTQEVFPAWYGTDWDFNGTTETPQSGEIACGYFISTTLIHSGFKVERYKLAQQSATIIIKTLCKTSTIQGFNDFNKMLNNLKQLPNGLYLVGLDTHIGFLEKKNGQIDFIHSSRRSGVIREVAEHSPTLLNSEVFVIGNLLENDTLIKAWLENEKIITQLKD